MKYKIDWVIVALAGTWATVGWLGRGIYWEGTHTCFGVAHAMSCSIHDFHWSIFSRLWS